MFGALDISTSALVAQRIRMDTLAGNLANAHTLVGEGQAYQRRVPLFAPGFSASRPDQPGVHVAEITIDTRPGELMWDPSHPYAMQSGPHKGYVRLPNVNEMNEMINVIEATRAYEANVTVIGATKTMASAALSLLG